MTFKKFPHSLGITRHVASQKVHLWLAPTLKSLSGGVSFRNLVRLGFSSFGVLRDFILINSGPIYSVNTFRLVSCFSKFLGASRNKGSGDSDWISGLALRPSEKFVFFFFFASCLLTTLACGWRAWLSWWEQCGYSPRKRDAREENNPLGLCFVGQRLGM